MAEKLGEVRVKLAEALALRADATRRVEQLRIRIVANARFQEGEEPSAAGLLAEAIVRKRRGSEDRPEMRPNGLPGLMIAARRDKLDA